MIGQVRQLYIVLKNERFFKIIGITCLIVLYGALAIFFADRYYHARGAGGIFDAIYWAVVTITTVGYGDIVPSSTVGKVFALMIVLSGPALLSLITASIASIFIERKIKEGKDCILLEIKRDDFLRLIESRPQTKIRHSLHPKSWDRERMDEGTVERLRSIPRSFLG
ncbi:MAG: two pore domain potassium channel family protein [Deltaproteobacteria bacterium]|nr:MAG: two pore domain potassium channel family protein [Deltaproteobacteria bacterium]